MHRKKNYNAILLSKQPRNLKLETPDFIQHIYLINAVMAVLRAKCFINNMFLRGTVIFIKYFSIIK